MTANNQNGVSLSLSGEAIDDLLYNARVGDLEDLKSCLKTITTQNAVDSLQVLTSAVDTTTGNTCLHYSAANGHKDIVDYLATETQDSNLEQHRQNFIAKTNNAGNTSLHYAALNGHLHVVKKLVASVSEDKRSHFVTVKNKAGHDAAFEAEGNNKESVVNYLLEVMDEADSAAAISLETGQAVGSSDENDRPDGDEEQVTIKMGNLDVDNGGE